MGLKGQFFAAAFTLAAASAASAQFWSVGQLPGQFHQSQVYDLSSDGRVAVGTISNEVYATAFTWTREDGRYDYGNEPQFPYRPQGRGISGDGRVAVGGLPLQQGDQIITRAYRWTGPGTFESLGNPGRNITATAIDANHDGSVIVGNLTNDRGTEVRPFRWTAAGGMQSLGFAGGSNTEAFGISDDGNTIVGNISGAGRGFVWTFDQGYRLMTGLPGSFNGNAAIFGTNRAGTIFVGNSFNATLGTLGAMWINDTVVNLGILQGTRGFYPSCVDDTGMVVAGNSAMLGPQIATVWTQARGLETLSSFLVSHGVTLPTGVELRGCSSVSADGRTFAGGAFSQEQGSFGYIVSIPAPSSLGLALCFVALTGRRRRSESSASCHDRAASE